MYSDVTFELDGKLVHAHRAILSVRSVYFRDLLSDNGSQDRNWCQEVGVNCIQHYAIKRYYAVVVCFCDADAKY